MESKSSRSFKIFIVFFLLFLFLTFVIQLSFVYQLNASFLKMIQICHLQIFNYGLIPFVAIGSVEISVSAFLFLSVVFYRRKEFQKAYLVLAVLLVGTATEFFLKQNIHHPRIPLEYRGRFPIIPILGSIEFETENSFPSGHSFRSMFLFGILFIWTSVVRHRKIFLWLVGIYLGVQLIAMNYYGFHWASDVIGGYYLAGLSLYLLKYVMRYK